LPYPVAPISPPRAGYGKDAEMVIKELEILKESFRDLNQRMGYKPIKNRYGWYWLKV